MLAAIIVWRLLLAAAAWFGFWSAMTGDFEHAVVWGNLQFFSQIATLCVALAATGGALYPLWHRGAIEGRAGVLRGGATTYSVVVLVIFATLLGGDYSSDGSRWEHLIVPIMALLDWLVVGRNQGRVAWWVPLAWLVVPLAYLPVYISASKDGPLYGFLDPGASDFGVWVAVLVAAFLAGGYLIWGIGKVRGLVADAARTERERANALSRQQDQPSSAGPR